MNSKFLLPSLGAIAVLISACAPLIPYQGQQGSRGSLNPVDIKAQEEARAEAERQRLLREKIAGENQDPKPPVGNGGDTKPVRNDYPRAVPIPGKDGYVFNPYTNNPVDVRGIPSRTLVNDPQDPDAAKHLFRVP